MLENPAGGIWQVIQGSARAFPSAAIFERIHFWYYEWAKPVKLRVLTTKVQTLDFIHEGPPWTNELALISDGQTIALFERESGEAVTYGIPSIQVFDEYQFDRHKVRHITKHEFNSYRMVAVLPPKGPAYR